MKKEYGEVFVMKLSAFAEVTSACNRFALVWAMLSLFDENVCFLTLAMEIINSYVNCYIYFYTSVDLFKL